jgi:hypothetical protein
MYESRRKIRKIKDEDKRQKYTKVKKRRGN